MNLTHRAAFFVAALSTAALPLSAQAATVSGKLVSLVAYVTAGDAMKGDAMKGDAMKGDAMKGDAMQGDHAMASAACPQLGLVTASGKLYFVSAAPGAASAAACAKIGATVEADGDVFERGGASVIVVRSVK